MINSFHILNHIILINQINGNLSYFADLVLNNPYKDGLSVFFVLYCIFFGCHKQCVWSCIADAVKPQVDFSASCFPPGGGTGHSVFSVC